MPHPSDDTTRTCSKCGKSFPATTEYFYKQKAGKYGLASWCKECHRQVNRKNTHEWYAKNKDHVSEYGKQYRANRQDEIIAYNKQYYWDNVERERERTKENKKRFRTRTQRHKREFYYRHREQIQEQRKAEYAFRMENDTEYRARIKATSKKGKAKRRALELNATGTHTAAEIRALYDQQQGKCWYCQCELNGKYHIDHFIPLSKGGSNDIGNIRLACGVCNLSKNNKMPWEFGRLL